MLVFFFSGVSTFPSFLLLKVGWYASYFHKSKQYEDLKVFLARSAV